MRELQLSDEDYDSLRAGREISGVWGRDHLDAVAGEVVTVTRPRLRWAPGPTVIDNPESMTARIVGTGVDPKGALLRIRT